MCVHKVCGDGSGGDYHAIYVDFTDTMDTSLQFNQLFGGYHLWPRCIYDYESYQFGSVGTSLGEGLTRIRRKTELG